MIWESPNEKIKAGIESFISNDIDTGKDVVVNTRNNNKMLACRLKSEFKINNLRRKEREIWKKIENAIRNDVSERCLVSADDISKEQILVLKKSKY